ncbi:MFS transporter [Plantibacter flavus]|uniref:MFS transporter n=1 Tax=Plantibacter flavus TaxID=150123 RepID=UPI0010C15D06|nr:MFS transporter [Plantibacter flavus]TKJ96962.1 MFS transporter [Plantibacter flavus]
MSNPPRRPKPTGQRASSGPYVSLVTGPSGPTERASKRVVTTMALAQFGLFVALLAPVTVSLALKTQQLVPGDQAAVVNGNVLSIAALFALVANPVIGRLSDITLSRFGRRRPWMFLGAIGFVASLTIVALAPNVPVLIAGWCLAQLTGNAILGPLLATIADQVPPEQRGSVSANVGVMQNVGILAAAFVASWFVTDMLLLFVAPAVFALITVWLYCFVLPDRAITTRPDVGGWKGLLFTFWVNPLKHPDFGWVWLSRFLLTLASFLFVAFRLFFLQEEVGLSQQGAVDTLTVGVLIYTIALVITAKLGGWLSDRMLNRKVFVIGSTAVFAVGLILLAHTTTVPMFYVVEAIMGAAYGVYVAVDTALVVDVLPNPDDAAKDLGVLNIANALPQSLAGAVGAFLLGLGAVGNNYTALFWGAGVIAVLGALTILPVRHRMTRNADGTITGSIATRG